MTVFRWIMGSVGVLLLVLTVIGYGVGLAFNNEIWLGRAKLFRQLLFVFALLWFNIEVWGRVAYTIVTWT